MNNFCGLEDLNPFVPQHPVSGLQAAFRRCRRHPWRLFLAFARRAFRKFKSSGDFLCKHFGCNTLNFSLRPRRLELPCLSAPAPQAGVSTSSTKAAKNNHNSLQHKELHLSRTRFEHVTHALKGRCSTY